MEKIRIKKAMLFIFAASVFFSCNKNSKYEDAIADHEQTMGSTKINLHLKIIETKELETITVKDSIRIIDEGIKQQRESVDAELKERKDQFIRDSTDYASWASQSFLDDAAKSYNSWVGILNTIYTNYTDSVNSRKELYSKRNSDEVLAAIVECRYTIKNPFLNNATQEITNKYIMSGDGSKCYHKFRDK